MCEALEVSHVHNPARIDRAYGPNIRHLKQIEGYVDDHPGDEILDEVAYIYDAIWIRVLAGVPAS